MRNEMTEFLEKLVYPVELIESRLERTVASMTDTPTASRIFIRVCCGFVMCLALSIYLSIAVILMSILAVVCLLANLKNLMSRSLTAGLAVARRLILICTPLWQRLLRRVRQ